MCPCPPPHPEWLLEESSYVACISLSIIEASVFSDKPGGSTGSCSRKCPESRSCERGVWMLFTMYRWFALLLFYQVWNKHPRMHNILVSGRHYQYGIEQFFNRVLFASILDVPTVHDYFYGTGTEIRADTLESISHCNLTKVMLCPEGSYFSSGICFECPAGY